jgi:hypothetical protein
MREVLRALREKGPLVGRELYEATGLGIFDLWRFCKKSKEVALKRVSRRYLRFDREIKGYARLSPSLQREFLTYTVVGLKGDEERLKERALALREEIRRASREKLSMAGDVLERVVARLPERGYVLENACFIIGGDVPIGMAHSDPRPEPSTGRLVSGSDLDIVVITAPGFPEQLAEALDEEIYREKYRLLKQPRGRVEIDYVIKDLGKVEEQARLRSFEDHVACKIIEESRLLLGSSALYEKVRGIMRRNSVPLKLRELRKLAAKNRRKAEKILLSREEISEEDMKLFATSEEYGEIF